MITKTIEIDENYFIEITYNESDFNARLYCLYYQSNNEVELIEKSFNRDKFLTNANKIVKLSNQIEYLVASY